MVLSIAVTCSTRFKLRTFARLSITSSPTVLSFRVWSTTSLNTCETSRRVPRQDTNKICIILRQGDDLAENDLPFRSDQPQEP